MGQGEERGWGRAVRRRSGRDMGKGGSRGNPEVDVKPIKVLMSLKRVKRADLFHVKEGRRYSWPGGRGGVKEEEESRSSKNDC
jgi:hypothetical protein